MLVGELEPNDESSSLGGCSSVWKYENRMPKSERNSKREAQMFKTSHLIGDPNPFSNIGIWDLFRISILVLRIYCQRFAQKQAKSPLPPLPFQIFRLRGPDPKNAHLRQILQKLG